MSDDPTGETGHTGTDLAPAPAAPTGPGAEANKMLMETPPYLDGMRPNPAYWQSPARMDRVRDLCRGEATGAKDAVRPAEEADADLPGVEFEHAASAYDLTGLPITNGEDRDVVDSFLPAAYLAGIGQDKARGAIKWALTETAPTINKFVDYAIQSGFSDPQISACVKWFKEAQSERT